MTEQNQNQNPAQQLQQGTQPQIDYKALEKMLDGRINASTESALKGILKSQYGLDGDELAEAAKAYKAQKDEAQKAEAQQHQAIIDENAKLKSMIQNAEIEKAIASLSTKANIDPTKAGYLNSLISRDGLIDAEGKLAEKTLQERFDKVLTDFPFFKDSAQQQGGAIHIVGANQSGGGVSETSAKLDAIFGIRK